MFFSMWWEFWHFKLKLSQIETKYPFYTRIAYRALRGDIKWVFENRIDHDLSFSELSSNQSTLQLYNNVSNVSIALWTFCTILILGARLHLFGSSKNGFGFKNSDIDICMTLEDHAKDEVNYDCRHLLFVLFVWFFCLFVF